MLEKKRDFETEMMTLRPIYFALGETPHPKPKRQVEINRDCLKPNPKNEGMVKKLIAFLTSEK
jgi:hypothetical protein